MWSYRVLVCVLFVLGQESLFAQTVSDADSALTQASSLRKTIRLPNPKSAVRWAILPGAGQIYNRDYWKAPIVYAALGTGIYTYHLNNLKYHDFLSAYQSFYDASTGQLLEGVTVETTKPVLVRNLLNTSSTWQEGTRDQIERQKNYWRRNKNLALITSGLIYALSIIEANTSAHLKSFDISDDLSMDVRPDIRRTFDQKSVPALTLTLHLK